jgi:hypothetical protein
VATTIALLLLPEKARYPTLGAYPKYSAFTLHAILQFFSHLSNKYFAPYYQ